MTKKILQLIITTILLNRCLVVGQDQIIKKTILILDLSSFYSQTIQEINLPVSSPKLQSIPPSFITSTTQDIVTMNSVLPSSFPVNSNQKNVVFVVKEPNENQFDFYLTFGNIIIENNIVRSQELIRTKFLTDTYNYSTSTTMFAENEGFVIVWTSYNYQSVYYFILGFQNEQLMLFVSKVFVYDQISNNSKPKSIIWENRIITYTVEQYTIRYYVYLKNQKQFYEQYKLQVACKDLSYFQEINYIRTFYIVQSCNSMVSFYYIGEFDFLQSQDIYIDRSSFQFRRFSQSVNNNIFLIFLANDYFMVCRIKIIDQKFSLDLCQEQLIKQNYQQAVFVTDLLLMLSNENSLILFDFSQAKIIYQQSAPDGFSFYFYNFLNDQALFTIQKGTPGQYYETQSIQFASPSIIINGQTQTIQFSITVGPIPLVCQSTIQVQVVTSPQYTLITPSVTFGATFSGQVYNDEQAYVFPIEDYITGQNLSQNIQLRAISKNLITKMEISQLKDVQFTSTIQIDNSTTAYQLNQQPYYSLLQQQQSDNQFQISYAKILTDVKKVEVSFPENNIFDTPISLVDNSGCFQLKSDSNTISKRILIPVINDQQQIQLNILQVECDTTLYSFTFSSDLQTGDILVMCGLTITHYKYLRNFKEPFDLLIAYTFQFQGFDNYNLILCLDGRALIYGKTLIRAYDYVNIIFIGVPIEISQLEESQSIVLFKDSFFILFILDNNAQINQYSYKDFSSSKAQLLRTLEYDDQFKPNIQIQPIVLRSNSSNNFDYLLIGISGFSNQYFVYRVNNSWSQNQLYCIITIENGLNIFSGDIICSLGQNLNCQQILSGAELSLKFAIDTSSYQNSILQEIVFTAAPKSNVDNQKNTQIQIYTFVLRRDTSSKFGIVNQQAPSIEILKTTLQDGAIDMSNNPEVFLSATDPSIYNANLLGWEINYQDGQIVNRLLRGEQQRQSIMKYIVFYDLVLLVSNTNFSINSIIIKDNVNYFKCVCLEDSSQTIQKDATTQFNIYFICEQKIDFYQILLTKNNENIYLHSNIIGQNSFPLYEKVKPSDFMRLFSSKTKELILDSIYGKRLIDFNYSGEYANIQYIYQFPFISQNIILSFNRLILQFQMNGQIITTFYNNDDINKCQLYNIKTLLISFHFIVNETDVIKQIVQISDEVFLFQFKDSYIYKITFKYEDNNILGIESAISYDYKDGFYNLLGFYSENNYTIIVGNFIDNQVNINLYINNYQKQNCNLINSYSFGEIRFYERIFLNVIEFNRNKNQFNFFLSDSTTFKLYVHNDTSIFLNSQPKNTFSIFPMKQDADTNIINFSYTSGGKISSSGTNLYSFQAIIIIQLFLIFL